MLEGQKSICTFETICTSSIEFRHLNFGIKEAIGHSISPFFFQYHYATRFFTNFLLVKMKGNISKEMTKKMKRRKSLKFELGNNQAALKFDYEDGK